MGTPEDVAAEEYFTPPENITCPFCEETGFDKIGLKYHLNNSCKIYQNTESII